MGGRVQVSCQTCGWTQTVNFAACLQRGWPKCCGETMEMQQQPPDEREEPDDE